MHRASGNGFHSGGFLLRRYRIAKQGPVHISSESNLVSGWDIQTGG
jgi:hypothetical protein